MEIKHLELGLDIFRSWKSDKRRSRLIGSNIQGGGGGDEKSPAKGLEKSMDMVHQVAYQITPQFLEAS